MIIRALRTDEWRSWRDLRLRALADAPDAFGETLAEVRERDEPAWGAMLAPGPDAIALLAERDGSPIGMMTVALQDDRRRARISSMWVAAQARGVGTGKALLAAGLAWARGCGALDVELRVSERQAAARALYERAGFRPTGQRSWLRPGSPVASETLAIRLAPLVMGVVNVTPDSFSDGGVYLDPTAAIDHGLALRAAGADLLDVGGEATNPRATAVPADVELRRVLPVIEALAAAGATVSVDTTKSTVARHAVAAGARIVNDVAGGLFDPKMPAVLAALVASGAHDLTYIAGHLRGRTLAEVFRAESADLSWQTVADELGQRLAALPPGLRTWVDPGIGFGKGADPAGNVALIRHAGDIAVTAGRPVVIGVSRKRFLRRMLGIVEPPLDVLDAASTLASLAAVRAGAHVVRVHNVTLLRAQLTAYNNH